VNIQSPFIYFNHGQATDEERSGKRTKVYFLMAIIVAHPRTVPARLRAACADAGKIFADRNFIVRIRSLASSPLTECRSRPGG
jgi:hypothetical protein